MSSAMTSSSRVLKTAAAAVAKTSPSASTIGGSPRALSLLASAAFQPQQQQTRSFRSFTVTKNSTSNTQRFFSSSSGGKRDFYKVLGVDRSVDKAAVKKAYFKLAKQYHPDTNQGDESAEQKFKEVTEAYEVLSDEKQREMYNQFGHAGVDPNFSAGGGGNPFGGGGGGGFDFNDGSFHFGGQGGGQEMDPEELFDMFFGGGGGGGRRRNRGPRRGADLQMHVRLTFKEAVFGASKDLNLRYQTVNRKTGESQVKEREVTVDTPPGIDNGMNMRLQGQGAEGDPGAASGNLLVQVIVDADDYFHRDGYDVHVEVPVSVTQAILGGTVDVKTLTGEVEMKVPKACQIDTKLMLRGKGIQQLHGTAKGNQIVHLKVEIPKEITARQEELLREFDEETGRHDLGISGRIANAAGSAFEKLFGKKKEDAGKKDKKDAKKENKKADKEKNSKTKESSDEEEEDDKKQAAQ